jgi:hypothetical protein
MQFIIENLPRAKNVCVEHFSCIGPISVNKWSLPPAMLSGKELPFLETFDLSLGFGRRSNASTLMTNDVFDLPPMRSPFLRSLRIYSFYIPFDPTTLSSLELVNSMNHPLPSPSTFIDMLRSCLNVQVLKLRFWIPNISFASDLEPTINLPSLKKLDVLDVVPSCFNLWSHIAFPQHPTLSITFNLDDHSFYPVQWSTEWNSMNRIIERDYSLPIDGIALFQVPVNDRDSSHLAFFSSNPAAQAPKFTGLF